MKHIECATFIDPEKLTQTQLNDLATGVASMQAFYDAVRSDTFWSRPDQWPLTRCVLAALCVQDVLRAAGFQEAKVVRTGLDLQRTFRGFTNALTIGDPSSPQIEKMLNAHMVVRLGDILLDPTFGQMKRPWNVSPNAVALLFDTNGNRTIEIEAGNKSKITASHHFQHGERQYQVTYFQLPRSVDVRTRKWRDAPDAKAERRQPLVRSAATLFLARMEAEPERAQPANCNTLGVAA